jgi:hypothetical protein
MSDPQFEQFEHMEPSEDRAANACTACGRAIPETYFEAAGRIFCAQCRDGVIAATTGGSGAVRLAKALVLGAVAATVSAVVWYAIVKLTGYELGIIAVAVGFAVGAAVRFGAEYRGGWAYQAIAIVLTYLAIAASYVPAVFEGISEKYAAVATQADVTGTIEPSEPETTELLLTAIVISLAGPVLQLWHGGLIGFLIVGFALYEAWKINKRHTIAFSGPFRLQRTA